MRILFLIVIIINVIETDGQIISQSVTTVNDYVSSPRSKTTGGSFLTFSEIIRQKAEGNQVQQCPCVRPPGVNKCITYDSRFQGASIEEAILTFVDTSMDPRIFDDRLGAPISATSLSCSSEECRQCAVILAIRLRQLGLLQQSPTFSFPLPAFNQIQPQLCRRLRLSRAVPNLQPPTTAPSFVAEMVAAGLARLPQRDTSPRTAFGAAVAAAIRQARSLRGRPFFDVIARIRNLRIQNVNANGNGRNQQNQGNNNGNGNGGGSTRGISRQQPPDQNQNFQPRPGAQNPLPFPPPPNGFNQGGQQPRPQPTTPNNFPNREFPQPQPQTRPQQPPSQQFPQQPNFPSNVPVVSAPPSQQPIFQQPQQPIFQQPQQPIFQQPGFQQPNFPQFPNGFQQPSQGMFPSQGPFGSSIQQPIGSALSGLAQQGFQHIGTSIPGFGTGESPVSGGGGNVGGGSGGIGGGGHNGIGIGVGGGAGGGGNPGNGNPSGPGGGFGFGGFGRKKRAADDGILGDRFVISCVERGDTENEASDYLNLCTACWTWRQLPPDYFPRLINELVCNENDYCLSGWGSCHQRYRNVDVLRRGPNGWQPTSISVATCCDCKVKAGTEVHALVIGKNKS